MPTAIDDAAGVTVIDCNVTPAVTVRTVEPMILPDAHLIVAVPAVKPVAKPCVPTALLTVATVALLEFQVTDCVRLKVLPALNVPVA